MRTVYRRTSCGVVEIKYDGRTVWANDVAGNLGRFSRFGIDVHRTLVEQENGAPECIACTHSEPHLPDWRQFQSLMQQHHDVVIGDECMPLFIRNAIDSASLGPYRKQNS